MLAVVFIPRYALYIYREKIIPSHAYDVKDFTAKDFITFYLTCVRPVAEYACPVFHDSLPQNLSQDLEKLQKRALRIIYPGLSYPEALSEAGIVTLFDRR